MKKIIYCDYCKKEIIKKQRRGVNHFCNIHCRSNFNKGKKRPAHSIFMNLHPSRAMLGKKHTEETKLKMSLIRKGKKQNKEWIENKAKSKRKGNNFNCLNCGNMFWRSPSNIKNGNNKFCSKKCYQIWQKGKIKSSRGKPKLWLRGSNNPNWKGGKNSINNQIRNSLDYKIWRKNILERDNYICQECGISGNKSYLNVHHIKPFSLYYELRFDNNNAITLCKKCHYKKPKGSEILCMKLKK